MYMGNTPFLTNDIDLFDNVNSRFEQDWDQGRGLDWFSRSAVRLRMHLEPVGNFTTRIICCIFTNFVVNTCQNMYKIKVNLCPSCF